MFVSPSYRILLATLALAAGLVVAFIPPAQAQDTPVSEEADRGNTSSIDPSSETRHAAPDTSHNGTRAHEDDATTTRPSNETSHASSSSPASDDASLDSIHDHEGSSDDSISDEELEALMRAFEEDQSATADSGAAPEAAPRRNVGAAIMNALNPEMSLILDVAASYFSDTPMQLGAHDPQRTGFTFQQLEMAFQANVDPYFLFRANLVFSEFGVEVEEAYAQTTSLPGRLQLRAGQFLSSFGRLNSTHPHTWNFLDQPMVNGKFFGGEGQRGLGAEASWLAPTPWYLEVIGSVMHGDGDCCARSFLGSGDTTIRGLQDFLYLVALKTMVPFNSDWSLTWGLSALLGPNSTGYKTRSEIYGTDLYLRYRPVASTNYSAFSLQVEVMHRRRQVPDDVLADTGLYAQAVWNINRRWETGLRYEWVGGSANDDLDPEWVGARQRTSIQGTFYPSHFSRIRLQGNHDAPSWRPRPIWSAMLGLEFVVGAHGAHDF